MKVHIILDDAVRSDSEARQAFLDRLLAEVEFFELNRARFDRHGILSGDLTEEGVDKAARIPGVKAIERDGVQRIIRERASGPRRHRENSGGVA